MVLHAQRHEVFKEDGRHVMPSYVVGIMTDFQRAFVKSETQSTDASNLAPAAQKRRGPHFIDMSSAPMAMASKLFTCG